jgi:hypothetical protein
MPLWAGHREPRSWKWILPVGGSRIQRDSGQQDLLPRDSWFAVRSLDFRGHSWVRRHSCKAVNKVGTYRLPQMPNAITQAADLRGRRHKAIIPSRSPKGQRRETNGKSLNNCGDRKMNSNKSPITLKTSARFPITFRCIFPPVDANTKYTTLGWSTHANWPRRFLWQLTMAPNLETELGAVWRTWPAHLQLHRASPQSIPVDPMRADRRIARRPPLPTPSWLAPKTQRC